jgi:hypothetical protein
VTPIVPTLQSQASVVLHQVILLPAFHYAQVVKVLMRMLLDMKIAKNPVRSTFLPVLRASLDVAGGPRKKGSGAG